MWLTAGMTNAVSRNMHYVDVLLRDKVGSSLQQYAFTLRIDRTREGTSPASD